jgi:hypothetical protein
MVKIILKPMPRNLIPIYQGLPLFRFEFFPPFGGVPNIDQNVKMQATNSSLKRSFKNGSIQHF